MGFHTFICVEIKTASAFRTTYLEVNLWKNLLVIWELTVLSVFTPLWLIGVKQCLLRTIRLPTTWLPAWPVASVYTENTVLNVHTFSPGFILLTAGLQVEIRDTETAPEELLFELRKPPEHGVLLKDTAEFPGPMASGSCSLCHRRISCSAVSFMCLRQ